MTNDMTMTAVKQGPLWTTRARRAMQGPIGHADVMDEARRSAELPLPRDHCDDEQRRLDGREPATLRMTGGRAEGGWEGRSERGSGQEGQFGTRVSGLLLYRVASCTHQCKESLSRLSMPIMLETNRHCDMEGGVRHAVHCVPALLIWKARDGESATRAYWYGSSAP
eukprot:8264915-Pyramimonas_sp.AAC.2